jgi:hypothetical protein
MKPNVSFIRALESDCIILYYMLHDELFLESELLHHTEVTLNCFFSLSYYMTKNIQNQLRVPQSNKTSRQKRLA